MNGKFEEYLQNIQNFVQIDDKIVTYKWISKALKVHSNTAKQLLYSFTKKPEVKEQLLITYIVAGEPNGGSGLNFRLVREDELEETKKKFSKVTTIHVYSVQKGTKSSVADLYNADGTFELSAEDQKFCSIQPSMGIKRREIVNSPTLTNDPGASVETKKPIVSQSSKPVENKTKELSASRSETKEDATKRPSPKKGDSKKPTAITKSGGIGALFMKQAAKNKVVTANKAIKEKEDEEKKIKESSDEKPYENTELSKVEIEKKRVNGKETEKNMVKTPPTKHKSQPKKKRKKPGESKDPAAKRRKRIQIASDSERSDESESDGDQRYPSPEPEPEAPTVIESEEEEIIPATPVERGRKRVRKLVDRTYEDDEGYIITKKEYVFESCSDDDSSEREKNKTEFRISKEELSSKAEEKGIKELQNKSTSSAKKEEGKKTATKKSEEVNKTESTTKKPGRPPSKAKANSGSSPKKQASIMSFFKKK